MPVNLAYRAYRLMWEALDWLYPPTCGGCGQQGIRWCESCAVATCELQPPICPICGDFEGTNGICPRCHAFRPYFECLRSFTVYKGPVREAVHRLKYERYTAMAEIFSRSMITSLEKLNWSLDIVTSVPLGLVRFKERGYNQANLLARPIGLWFKLPLLTNALKRTRETPSQVGLTAVERRDNMVDAFKANGKLVAGKNVLVVDDVATSGATLNACARALLDEGAIRVYCFTLARAVYTPHMELDIS